MQADKIVALTTAAGVEVESIWATLLAKALEGKDVKDLLSNVGAGGGAPAAGAPAAAGGAAAADVPKEEEKKEEEKEESDDDMVRPLRFYRLCVLLTCLRAGLRSLRLICRTLEFSSICCLLSLHAFTPPRRGARASSAVRPVSITFPPRTPKDCENSTSGA